jgi:hypothetical protein
MADGISSLEDTITALAAGQMPRRRKRAMMADEKTTVVAETVTKEESKAAVDKALGEGMELGLKQGREEGAKAERERILGIERVALPGHEALVAEMKADGKTSPGDAAIKIAETEKANRSKRLDAIKSDGQAAPAISATAMGEKKPVVVDESAPLEERAKAAWDADPKLRTEFESVGGFEGYLAWRKAEAHGQARILRAVK